MTERPGMLLAVLNVGLGAALLLGGAARVSAPSFAMPLEVASREVWALAFLLGGAACAAAASIGWRGIALLCIGPGVHAFWAVALALSVRAYPNAALTGVVVYGWTTLLHITTAARLARQVG